MNSGTVTNVPYNGWPYADWTYRPERYYDPPPYIAPPVVIPVYVPAYPMWPAASDPAIKELTDEIKRLRKAIEDKNK